MFQCDVVWFVCVRGVGCVCGALLVCYVKSYVLLRVFVYNVTCLCVLFMMNRVRL